MGLEELKGRTKAVKIRSMMSSHPNFDDGGAVAWHTELAAGREVARQSDKLLFIECGRQA